jgi:hypothetical protein
MRCNASRTSSASGLRVIALPTFLRRAGVGIVGARSYRGLTARSVFETAPLLWEQGGDVRRCIAELAPRRSIPSE